MTDAQDPDTGVVVVIFNDIPPYAYEVNNMLAVPEGFAYRFRFRRKYMPTIADPMGLKGRDGLAVLREFATGRFVPLRWIRITHVKQVGDVYHFGYTVARMIETDSTESVRQEQLDKFNKQIVLELAGRSNDPGRNLESLIFSCANPAYGFQDAHFEGQHQDREFNNWGNLVQVLGNMGTYKDLDFLKIVGMVDRSDRTVTSEREGEHAAAFNLASDSLYRLRVFQRTYPRHQREGDSSVDTRRQLALVSEPEEIRVLQPSYSVGGKYDLYEFPFKTARVSARIRTALALEVRRDDIAPPNIDIPVSISLDRRQRVFSLACGAAFLFGVALLFGGNQIAPHTGLQPELVKAVGILLMIISSYGAGPAAQAVLKKVGVEHQV